MIIRIETFLIFNWRYSVAISQETSLFFFHLKFPSVVDLNNAKEVDEQSDIWPDEAFEVEDTGAYEIIQTAQKGEIEEQIVKEIPAPIHLLCPLMERLRLCGWFI